jgi:hypothetical protein
MYVFLENEQQYNLLNAIMNSTKELIPLLKLNFNVDNTIHKTITKILLFLNKTLKMLPGSLTEKSSFRFPNEEILESFNQVLNCWDDFPESKDLFFEAWEEFEFWWCEYKRSTEQFRNLRNKVFISMN